MNVDLGTDDSPNLRRQIGLVSSVSYITGNIIGSGIFISPSYVLQEAGSSVGVSLFIWLLCGMISYCGALCYAELGTRVNKSGGSYTYVKEAFGDCAGFVFLWTQLVLTRPMSASLSCLAAAEYIIRPVFLDCPDMAPTVAKIFLALVVMGAMVAVNFRSVRIAAYFQTFTMVCKLLALTVIIISGIVHLVQGHVEHFETPFRTTDLTPGRFVQAVYAGLYAYIGWDIVNMAVEEIIKPRRTIPISILLGLAIPTVVYILVNVAYHAVLTNGEILSGVAVAVVYGKLQLGWFMWAIISCIGISAIGSANGDMFTSRVNFVGGRDGLFPSFLGMVSVKRRTPQPSILTLAFFALAYVCLGDMKTLLGAFSFFRALGEFVGIAGIFRLRKMYPTESDTYTVHSIFAIIYLVFFTILSLTAIISQPTQFLVPMVVCLAGIPVYYLSQTNWWKRGNMAAVNRYITYICQRLLLCDFASKNE